MSVVLSTEIESRTVRRGKVRDVYDLGEELLLVSTDRISAFDWVLPTGIPDKGRVLTQLSAFWFDLLEESNHKITTDIDRMPLPDSADREVLRGRSMLVRKASVVPVECVVRGYLAGSGWKEYQRSCTVCEVALPEGLSESAQLPEPIFTPATKAEEGHDENIPFARMADLVGRELAEDLRRRSIALYRRAADYARERGIILADTKFEWGLVDGSYLLVDEAFTPDSSRFWPADEYEPGRPQNSFDKQFVRDWLESTTWDKNSEPPALPTEIVERTREKYLEAFRLLTGSPLDVAGPRV